MHRRTFLAASTALAAASAMSFRPAFAADAAGPMTAPWTGPYGGVPPFDKVEVAGFAPALETAMAAELADVDAIANNPAAPSFDNTIAAMERSGRMSSRVYALYGVWTSTMDDEAMQKVEQEMEPKLAAHSDKILQNAALFKRIAAVHDDPASASLTPEQQRLVWLYYTRFVRAGAKLSAADKARVAEINTELAGHFTTFSQNLLADEEPSPT